MSLTSKLVLILSAVVALYALTDYAIQRVTVTRSFHALERAEALRDVERVVEAIREEEARLDQYCKARAAWYGTSAYAVGMDLLRGFPGGRSARGRAPAAAREHRTAPRLLCGE